jgi:TolB-like protein/Tfp pilus assembly protein PilF
VVLYEMAAGVRPFEGSTGFELSSAIMNQTPPPLATGPTGTLPPEFGTIIERCLEKEPDQRYQQCADVRAALEAVQSGGAVPAWEGRKPGLSRRTWLALAAVLAAALVLVIAVLTGLNLEGVRDRLLGGGVGAPRFRSLAVLPVANLSGDPAEEYYADGMTYTLIANVSKIGALRVISRSSVMPYKGTKKPLPEIARELNVDTVLETSVAREGGRVHMTAQLIEAAADRNLWAETYDRPAADVLRLQSEVAREIARQINVTLTPEQSGRLTNAREVNPKVYEAYLRGKFYVSQNTPGSFEKGIQYLRQAVEIDPAEPLSWVGLAEGYVSLGHGGAEQIDSFPRARAAAEQALKLDPDAAEAVGVLADVALYYEWDWVKAENLFKRALELSPSLAGTHYHYAWYLALFDRLDEAIAEHKLARDHAPLQPANTGWLGGLYNFAGRYDEAIVEAKKALELEPKYWPGYRILSIAYSHKGMHPEAIAAAQRIVEFSPFTGNAVLGAAYALAGQREQALAIAGRLEQGVSQGPQQRLAELYVALGDRDAVFRELEAAYEAHVTSLPWIRVHGGLYDSVRDDPRFQNLLRRMKLPL